MTIVVSKGGKVRLLKPDELPADWDPAADPRLTVWEIVHHLIRVLEAGGEGAAAAAGRPNLARRPKSPASWLTAFTLSAERKKRAAEALSYNGLVQSWPEIMRLARESAATTGSAQADMFA